MICIILCCPDASIAQRQRPVQPVEMHRISENLYEFTGGGICRVGAYIGDDCVMLIDAMQDEQSMKNTIAELERISGKPVRYLVNTHADYDHIDGIRWLTDDITVICHENAYESMLIQDDGEPSDWNKPELQRFRPDLTFTDRMTLHLGSKVVELHYFGIGHTTGDIVVHIPEENIAFVGDQAGVGGVQLIHAVKGGNSFGHVRVLEKLLGTLDVETYYFGHYPPGGRDVIRQRITDMNARHEMVRSLIGEGKSLEDVLAAFPRQEQRLVTVIYSEIREGRDR